MRRSDARDFVAASWDGHSQVSKGRLLEAHGVIAPELSYCRWGQLPPSVKARMTEAKLKNEMVRRST